MGRRVNFIGRKGIPMKNVLTACDFNLCFTFVLAGFAGTTHDSRILVWVIHSPEIHFSHPASGKYYLVDSGFTHRSGYIALYKGSNILYHRRAVDETFATPRRNLNSNIRCVEM